MEILFFIIFVVIVIYVLSKRVKNLEQSRGRGYSQSFSINTLDAVSTNRMFGKLSKIKSSEEEKPYKEWVESERNKWHKEFSSEVEGKVSINITYLASEEAFYIKTKNEFGFLLPLLGRSYLYNACLIGEDSYSEDHLEFGIADRIVDYREGKIRVITGYLQEHYKHEFEKDNKDKLHILFDFPFERIDMTDDDYKSLGFEVDRKGGDDIYTDIFGETHGIPLRLTYKKNGAKISYVV